MIFKNKMSIVIIFVKKNILKFPATFLLYIWINYLENSVVYLTLNSKYAILIFFLIIKKSKINVYCTLVFYNRSRYVINYLYFIKYYIKINN